MTAPRTLFSVFAWNQLRYNVHARQALSDLDESNPEPIKYDRFVELSYDHFVESLNSFNSTGNRYPEFTLTGTINAGLLTQLSFA